MHKIWRYKQLYTKEKLNVTMRTIRASSSKTQSVKHSKWKYAEKKEIVERWMMKFGCVDFIFLSSVGMNERYYTVKVMPLSTLIERACSLVLFIQSVLSFGMLNAFFLNTFSYDTHNVRSCCRFDFVLLFRLFFVSSFVHVLGSIHSYHTAHVRWEPFSNCTTDRFRHSRSIFFVFTTIDWNILIVQLIVAWALHLFFVVVVIRTVDEFINYEMPQCFSFN